MCLCVKVPVVYIQKSGTWKHSGHEDKSWIWGISVDLNCPEQLLDLE